MCCALRVILAAICILFLVQGTWAASVIVHPPNGNGLTYVTVVGDLQLDDAQDFQNKTANLDPHKVVVALISSGGNLMSALRIAQFIRTKEIVTLVPVDRICASACALIWLAGSVRFVEDGAQVGFHAAFDPSTGQE